MQKSILAICILILVCLFSCDLNFFNKLPSKVRGKFIKENKNEKNLNSIKEKEVNQESQKEQSDFVIKNGASIKINRGLHKQEKDINKLVHQTNTLTIEESAYLVSKYAEVNSIQNRVDLKLLEINKTFDELNKSLSALKDMGTVIIKAETDFEDSRKDSSINNDVKQSLHQLIDKVKNSRYIAIVSYEEKLNILNHAKARAIHAKSELNSALRESEQARASGYYYVDRMIDNISKARTSFNESENMFKKVELEIGKLRAAKRDTEKDFDDLKIAHQVLNKGRY